MICHRARELVGFLGGIANRCMHRQPLMSPAAGHRHVFLSDLDLYRTPESRQCPGPAASREGREEGGLMKISHCKVKPLLIRHKCICIGALPDANSFVVFERCPVLITISYLTLVLGPGLDLVLVSFLVAVVTF
jgi:hypothetical protein